MKNRLILFALILAMLASAHGQSVPTRKTQASSHSPASTAAEPKPSSPKFLTDSLDLDETNLGPGFYGHDIIAVVEAIKNSPALKEKSEFESTSEFEARRGDFVGKSLYANITASSHLAFVVDEDLSQFKYDADSQTMAVTLTGSPVGFMERSEPLNLIGILVQHKVLDRDSYIGSNAFGAQVEVSTTYSEEYGVAISPGNWLFRGQDIDIFFPQTFTYLLSMTPDQARAVKADAKLLLVCRLTPPWYHHGAHGHKATIDAPYETTVGDDYLQIVPEQLWVFNKQTGEVLRKLSESVAAGEANEQLDLKFRNTPLLLEITAGRTSLLLTVAIDGGPEETEVIKDATTMAFGAKRRIVLTLNHPESLSDTGIRVNKKPYVPNWSKDAVPTGIRNQEQIFSATAIITAP